MKPQLTIEAFADWCERQPAERAYDYHDYRTCACAQYAATIGLSPDEWIDKAIGCPETMWGTANCEANSKPWTFGALAIRLRAQVQS
jgi:hypothetical protein